MADSKQAYIDFCQQQPELGLYNTPWWLDVVSGMSNWDVLHIESGGNEFFLPYQRSRIRGMTALHTPHMTQWVEPLGTKIPNAEDLARLIAGAPRHSIFKVALGPGIPVEGVRAPYQTSTRYSYILHAQHPDTFRSCYSEGLRRNLNEAADAFRISHSRDISLLTRMVRTSLHSTPQWVAKSLPGAARTLFDLSRGELVVAYKGSDAVAAILTGFDNRATYYLAGGRLPDPGCASAHALLLDHLIQGAFTRNSCFDFEGSMLPGIANFFHSFGAAPMPFHEISHHSGLGKIWKIMQRGAIF